RTAARTISPTSSGSVPPARKALACAVAAPHVFVSSTVGDHEGRVSLLFDMIFVLTGPGHNTLTPILNGPSSSRRDSERPTTANFEVVYKRPADVAASPAPEAVLTICPPPPPFSIRGRKVWIPLITPFRLIPITQSQYS